MVNGALSIGGLVGVLLSGGFVYWQVGRYATPQVPETLFDERREIFAYTAGLFVGIPLSLLLLFYLATFAAGAFVSVGIDLGLLILAGELAQWALLRSRYFGSDDAGPFYALGLRAGIGGILTLALVAQYLSSALLTIDGVGVVLLQCVAVLAVELAAALVALPPHQPERPSGGPLSGAAFVAGGLGLLGFTAALGEIPGALGAAVVALGGVIAYRRRRSSILDRIRPPSKAGGERAEARGAFGRIDSDPKAGGT